MMGEAQKGGRQDTWSSVDGTFSTEDSAARRGSAREEPCSQRFDELLRELRAEHLRLLEATRPPRPSLRQLPPQRVEALQTSQQAAGKEVDSPVKPAWGPVTPPPMMDPNDTIDLSADQSIDLPGVLCDDDRRGSLASAGSLSIVPTGGLSPAGSRCSSPTKGRGTGSAELDSMRMGRRSFSSLEPTLSVRERVNLAFQSKRTDMWGNVVEEKFGLAKLVTSTAFELTMAILIFVNTMCIAMQAQYDGMDSGHRYKLTPANRGSRPAAEEWPGAEDVFLALDWFFGILFTIEFLLKAVSIPKEMVRDAWNMIDFSIVVFFWIEALSNGFLPLDPKVIRVARLVRLLRFLRVVKTVQAFDSLYLMIASIKGSISALGWSSVVLLLGEMMLALLLNIVLRDYWEGDVETDEELASKQKVYAHFGTFTKALFTMLELLLGNWYSITRMLSDEVSEMFVLFGICHQLFVGFAVIEVITGVFLHETFKVANLDDGIMLNEIRRAAKAETAKLSKFFQEADQDGNGMLEREEFKKVLENKQVEEWLMAMGLDLGDIDRVFSLLDKNGDGMLSCEELVMGASMLKGPARAMDLAVVRAMMDERFGSDRIAAESSPRATTSPP